MYVHYLGTSWWLPPFSSVNCEGVLWVSVLEVPGCPGIWWVTGRLAPWSLVPGRWGPGHLEWVDECGTQEHRNTGTQGHTQEQKAHTYITWIPGYLGTHMCARSEKRWSADYGDPGTLHTYIQQARNRPPPFNKLNNEPDELIIRLGYFQAH